MYTINNGLNKFEFNGLQAGKLLDINAREIIQISLEKETIFPTHTSPTNAHLIILEGTITFFIEGKEFQIKKHEVFDFPKHISHHVKALENSKFLIIR